jgi:predicted AlkP superfamily phosphohydrolase/phosphomutase
MQVYRAVDEQIAGLIELAGNDATIMVFALHGMRPALGFPAFLGPLLCERGFSCFESWTSQTWSKRALSLLGATKRHTPDSLKNLYYKLTPSAATHKLARPTMLPVYDWKTTRAFSLPTDQYGWIRVNLSGREAQGIVSVDQYDETCEQLEKMLLALTTDNGESLVCDITRTAGGATSALSNPLPDLVVHWEDAAFASPLRINNSKVRAERVSKKSTGQHASEGFCIYRGADVQHLGGVVAAKDLSRLIIANL